jgi:hypothetical protein
MRWRDLWRRRRLDLMPAAGGNGRERAARDALHEAENKARETDRKVRETDALVRRVDWLTGEVERMLTLRPGGGSRGTARR